MVGLRLRSSAAFTLVELLVATAVGSLLAALIVAVLVQFYQVTGQTANRLAALGDLTLATGALALDANSASVAAVTDRYHLTLSQPDAQGSAARAVTYAINPPLLTRSDAAGQQTIARHLTAASAFAPAGVITGSRLIVVSLVSARGNETVQTSITLGLRPQ